MKLVKGSVTEEPKTHFLHMLIGTKLDIPPLKSRMLQRPDLLRRLRSGRNARLILISGEAGSGKTSLSCQWIDLENLNVAWYTLNSEDNNSDIFLHYLLTALCKSDPTLKSILWPRLESQRPFSVYEVAPVLVQHFMKAEEDLYIVLDNYHLINNDEIHDAISHLLLHVPPRLHFVILTRNSLPFSTSTLRMQEQIVEITSRDLRFGTEETNRFFTEIMPCDMSKQQIEEAFIWTEGWVGGLQLFGLAFRENTSNHKKRISMHPVNSWIADYLFDEVINIQKEKVRNFILKTSLLHRFNQEVCEAITDHADAGEIIDYLFRNNLFIAALEEKDDWYRYHHLLSESVKQRCMTASSEETHSIHRKAAIWFAQNSLIDDALHHAFATEDPLFAADMFEDLMFLLMDRYELSSILEWLNTLPHELRRERAILLLHECHLHLEMMQVEKAEKILCDVENRRDVLFARYNENKRSNCEDLFILLKCCLDFAQNPLQTAKIEELEKIKFSPRNPALPIILKIAVATSFILQGENCQAINMLEEIEEAVSLSESPLCITLWFKLLAIAELHRGRLEQVSTLLEEASTYLASRGLSDTPLRFLINAEKAWVLYFKNDLTEAEELARDGLGYAETIGNNNNMLNFGFLIVMIHLAKGQLNEADQILQNIRPHALLNETWLPVIDALFAFAAMCKGDFSAAAQWLERKNDSTFKTFSLFECIECEIFTVLLCLLGRFQEASTVLSTFREKCIAKDMGSFVQRIDICSSAILSATGEHEKARHLLEQVLVNSERDGYVRPFITFAQFILPILKRIQENPGTGISLFFLATIVESCNSVGNGFGPCNGRSGNGNAILTNRELEILSLMVQGYKNREIAEKAFVSLHTVKTHLKHIFEKLHVETRIQAIKRAEDMKLLDVRHTSGDVASDKAQSRKPLRLFRSPWFLLLFLPLFISMLVHAGIIISAHFTQSNMLLKKKQLNNSIVIDVRPRESDSKPGRSDKESSRQSKSGQPPTIQQNSPVSQALQPDRGKEVQTPAGILSEPNGADWLKLEAPSWGTGGGSGGMLYAGSQGTIQTFSEHIQALNATGLDVVIALDSTSSMDVVIARIKPRIAKLIMSLRKIVPSCRIGVVTYRDRGDEYLTKKLPLTYNLAAIKEFIEKIKADGGSDVPEAVDEGLRVAVEEMNWNSKSKALILLIGDAPPHEKDIPRVIGYAAKFRQQQHGIISSLNVARDPIHNFSSQEKGSWGLGKKGQGEKDTGDLSNYEITDKAFAAIAEAGGGEAGGLLDEEKIVKNMLLYIIGTQWQAYLEEITKNL